MIADGRHEYNLFHLVKAPQMLYIRLTIKVSDSVHIKYIQKSLPANVILVLYEFLDGTISGSHIMYDNKLKTSGSPMLVP